MTSGVCPRHGLAAQQVSRHALQGLRVLAKTLDGGLDSDHVDVTGPLGGPMQIERILSHIGGQPVDRLVGPGRIRKTLTSSMTGRQTAGVGTVRVGIGCRRLHGGVARRTHSADPSPGLDLTAHNLQVERVDDGRARSRLKGRVRLASRVPLVDWSLVGRAGLGEHPDDEVN